MHSQVFLRGCWAVMSCVMAVMAWLVSGEGHSERHTHCLGPTWGNSLKRWDVLETEAKLVWIIYIYIWYIYMYIYTFNISFDHLWPKNAGCLELFGHVWTWFGTRMFSSPNKRDLESLRVSPKTFPGIQREVNNRPASPWLIELQLHLGNLWCVRWRCRCVATPWNKFLEGKVRPCSWTGQSSKTENHRDPASPSVGLLHPQLRWRRLWQPLHGKKPRKHMETLRKHPANGRPGRNWFDPLIRLHYPTEDTSLSRYLPY